MCSRRRKAPSVPASLQRSASASNRRFSLPENWRRLAIATTSGSRRAPSPEAISPVALPAPSATASEEEPDNPFREDFTNEVMFMSYLYSKLPETGVSPHIGTGGARTAQAAGAWPYAESCARQVRRDPNARRAFPHHRRPHLDSQPLHRTHRRPETSGPPTQTRSPTTAAATHHRARKDCSPPSQRRVVETFTMPALILLTFFAELGKLG